MRRSIRRNKLLYLIYFGSTVLILILFYLFWSFNNSAQSLENQRLQAETQRANQLKESLDALRARSDQDVKFFELVRQLIVDQDRASHEALIKKLKTFTFSEKSSQTTVPAKPSSASPRSSAVTIAPSPPPATTTTTIRSRPPPHKPRPPPITTTTTLPTTTITTVIPVVCITLPATFTTICT